MTNKVTVAVLFGGQSPEHEVSIISANQAINALKGHKKYEVFPVYVTKEGRWFSSEKMLDLSNFKDIKQLLANSNELSVSFSEACFFYYTSGFFKKKITHKIDVMFPVFHGRNGEDGGVQGLFELMNVPYVGSNILASANTMDKVTTKMILQESGVKVLPYVWFYNDEWLMNPEGVISKITDTFEFPVIVKPSDLGSSIGISKANDIISLEAAMQTASTYSAKILVEPAITQLKEINCSVMGNHADMETSVCEEPLGAKEILSFEDKYKSGSGQSKGMSSLKRKIPADISAEQEATIKAMAKATFKAFDSSGLVRIDFMIDQSNGSIYVNEINTIPGSLSFYLWQHSDINFTQLCERLIQIAVRRHSEKQRLTFTFEANLLSEFTSGKAGGKMGSKR